LINATGLWVSIKNEGNKRRMISDEQIRQIADLYASAEDGGLCRVLDYRVFGYRRIKVLRSLRMALHINEETISKLEEGKAWSKLSDVQKAAWKTALTPYAGQVKPFTWLEPFAEEAAKSEPRIGKVGKTFLKTMIEAFGVRDPEGALVLDANGNRVFDPGLTDYENVPILENIRDYFAREVLPHVPDSWIDESFLDDKDKEIGRIGYEINFNRFFYKFIPLRRVEEIDEELKKVEREIAGLLGELTE
jgi:type I restriction enzyme M protein